jgi:hypothetical protein
VIRVKGSSYPIDIEGPSLCGGAIGESTTDDGPKHFTRSPSQTDETEVQGSLLRCGGGGEQVDGTNVNATSAKATNGSPHNERVDIWRSTAKSRASLKQHNGRNAEEFVVEIVIQLPPEQVDGDTSKRKDTDSHGSVLMLPKVSTI